AVDAVRVAEHLHDAFPYVGQHGRRDGHVVVDEAALREATLREEHLLPVRDGHVPASHLHVRRMTHHALARRLGRLEWSGVSSTGTCWTNGAGAPGSPISIRRSSGRSSGRNGSAASSTAPGWAIRSTRCSRTCRSEVSRSRSSSTFWVSTTARTGRRSSEPPD